MIIVLLVFSLFYFLMLVLAAERWKGLIKRGPLPGPRSSSKLFLSVIVPARNEVVNIKALLTALSKQHFSTSHFEVILIDDHSEDDTVATAKTAAEALALPLRVISLREEKAPHVLKGKKMALQKGIEMARGNIIVTTDADCVMGENWLQSIEGYFTSPSVKMVVGPVTYHDTASLFGSMQTIEFAALIGIGAVSLDYGRPTMCNGANLAFDKEAFEKAGGYQDNIHIPSGDDEFLLQKIYRLFPQQVFFNANPKGIVATFPAQDLKSFVAQRKRWGGKWKLHKSPSVRLLALFIFFYHVVFVLSFFGAMLTLTNPYIFASLFFAKALLEYLFLKKVLQFLGKRLCFKDFVILQFIYSLYVLILGMLANFGSFEWKDRKY